MLLRYDPFRDFDRLATGDRRTPPMPVDAVKRGNHIVLDVDIPGVPADQVELTVERNVLTVRAERQVDRAEGDEAILGERRHGRFERQFFLGESLDPHRVEAEVHDGVLTIRVPIAETAAPRRIEVATSAGRPAEPAQLSA